MKVLKRPASASSSNSGPSVLKRPAAAVRASSDIRGPVLKRPAACVASPLKRPAACAASSSDSLKASQPEECYVAPKRGRPSNQDAALAAFPAWLRSAGVWWKEDALSFSKSSLHGCGVFASKSISKDEVVATIPIEACLGAKTCGLSSELNRLVAKGTLDDEIALTIAILYERRRGHRSPWAAYFDFLAADVPHTPQAWSREEQLLLAGTEADRCDAAGWRRCAQSRRMKQNRALLIGMEPMLERLLPPGGPAVKMSEFLEAVYWTESRSFNVGDEIGEALCPLADLFNHQVGAPAKGDLRQRNCGPRSPSGVWADVAVCSQPVESVGMQIVAMRDIRQGCEIFNCYGAYGNAKLLSTYGFCCRNNPHDVVVLRPSALVRAAASIQRENHGEVRQRIRKTFHHWSSHSGRLARQEVLRDGSASEASSVSADEFDADISGFSVGPDGRIPQTLRSFADCAANGEHSVGDVIGAAIRARRSTLRAAAREAEGCDVALTERRALAATVRKRELDILRALEKNLEDRSERC